MLSLTKTSIIARRIIRYCLFAFIFIFFAKTIFQAVLGIYRHYYPEPPPPPTVKFNKLPKLPFPDKPLPEGAVFKLETSTGELPKFSTQAKVFFMPKLSPYFGSLDKAKEKAGKMHFDGAVTSESETVYKFVSSKVPSELKINIVTGIFSLSYNLSSDSSPLERKPLAPEIASSKVKSFLSSADLLPEDLTGPIQSEFIRVENQQLVQAISLSDADLVKISLFRKSFDDLPSLTINPEESNVWFMVTGATEKEKEIVAGEFHHFPVEEGNYSTYPIKTSQQAWEEFNQGKAHLVKLGNNEGNKNITIRKMFLAYFDPPTPIDFYQPIVVFEGDGGFVAYIPAVTSDYYGE